MTSPRFIFNTDSYNVYIKPHSVLNGKEPQNYLHSCPDLSFSEMLIYEGFPQVPPFQSISCDKEKFLLISTGIKRIKNDVGYRNSLSIAEKCLPINKITFVLLALGSKFY